MSTKTNREEVDTTIQEDGQQKDYLILSEEERAKGFVRPVRDKYLHVGIAGPKYPLRDLSEEEKERFVDLDYVKFEKYPEGVSAITGRYWTQKQLDSVGGGCGALTSMSRTIAETYARNPHFYNGTFCATCKEHFPVGERGEFVWEDGSRVGT